MILHENQITPIMDMRIKHNLCLCFPHQTDYFSRSRGWNDVPSDITVVGMDNDDPIAHLGVAIRSIQVDGNDYRIFGLQNVYVVPSHRGKHLVDVLFTELLEYLKGVDLNFGLLFARTKVEHVYTRLGWKRMGDVSLKVKYGSGEVQQRKFIHDHLYFYPFTKTGPPEGPYYLNGPDW
nr:GNAT family N-acetyltransferase [Sphaerochaeta halotolerans]